MSDPFQKTKSDYTEKHSRSIKLNRGRGRWRW